MKLKIQAVIETAIYVDDLQASATFYGKILDAWRQRLQENGVARESPE